MDIAHLIGSYLIKMIPPASAGIILTLAAFPLRQRRLSQKGLSTTLWHEVWLCLFFGFLSGLFALVVLPSGRIGGSHHYNLIPFRIFADIGSELRAGNVVGFWISFLGNIVMFLPCGFLPALLWRDMSLKKGLLTGALLSLTIELCQFPLGRSADVDDLWMNTLAAGLGFGLYRMLKHWKPQWASCCKVILQSKEEATS